MDETTHFLELSALLTGLYNQLLNHRRIASSTRRLLKSTLGGYAGLIQ